MEGYILSEDLAVWFGKKKKSKNSSQPKGPWVNICKKKKGGGHPPCGRKDADKGGYPVCRAAGVASKMSQSAKDSACRRKREKEKKDTQTGKGQSPTNIKIKNYNNESLYLKNIIKESINNLVVESNNISEELQYHLNNKISITNNIFRHGSDKYFNVVNEARKLKDKGYRFDDFDIEILESEVGTFVTTESGKILPLDFPMINEKGQENTVNEQGFSWDGTYANEIDEQDEDTSLSKSETIPTKLIKPSNLNPKSKKIFGLSEAEYKGKDVSLNKPKSGGPKKWFVYVRNPKTGNVKKISYGSPVMTAKWNDPAARKSFAARHRCEKKKDRTKAGYWACRAHKDFGKNVSGRYW